MEPFGIGGSSFNEASSIAGTYAASGHSKSAQIAHSKIFKRDYLFKNFSAELSRWNFIDPNANKRFFFLHYLSRRD